MNRLYQNHTLIYKTILFLFTVFAIVYMFPKGGHFKYEFQKGKPWQYDNLFAPFDFAIQKSKAEVEKEKGQIISNRIVYFTYDAKVKSSVKKAINQKVLRTLNDSILGSLPKGRSISFAQKFVDRVYKIGYLDASSQSSAKAKQLVNIRKGNEVSEISFEKIFTQSNLEARVSYYFDDSRYKPLKKYFLKIFKEKLKPNLFYDAKLTDKVLQKELNGVSYVEGLVAENERVISRGDVVEGRKFQILNSLKNEYESQLWSESNYGWIVVGYTILIALALLMLLLFLKVNRPSVFDDNTKVTLIFFNMLLMVLLVTLVVRYRIEYIYVVPLIILPIVLKAFFDARLALFVHVLTVLLLGFIVPNSFEFIFLQILAGIVTVLTVTDLYKRANLFISISQITVIYIIAYFAFSIIHEGNMEQIKWEYFAMFALNGVLSFLSLFLILIYEKVFGLVSDVSLLELSNTNSKLLRELNEKAPGTFQHSMQVANLAEASANEIGANAMLVRTGALYHDIGKMLNPMYFTENQTTSVNPHNEVSPRDSAKIIIDHVLDGIELAKKNSLPDRIIDFIRTHHGTSLVYYFYKQQEALDEGHLNIEDFRYKGPIPFSKETAILMMCDAAEAASKSLKEPSAQLIDDLIEKVIDGQMNNGQFMNADITFKEIETIKKVIKKKLNNIYHLRIEYPE